MYDYLTSDALDFVKKNTVFKQVTIKKAYELKSDGYDIPELIESIDNFLKTIGAPLNEIQVEECPYCDCYGEEKEEEEEEEKEEEEEEEEEEEKEEKEEEEKNKNRSILMQKLLKEENLIFNDKVMDLYYEWVNDLDISAKMNRYKMMKLFIEANKHALMEPQESQEPDPRKTLLMSIFKKKNIEFKDNYMHIYYNWEKNAPRLNRYKKMCAFIEQF